MIQVSPALMLLEGTDDPFGRANLVFSPTSQTWQVHSPHRIGQVLSDIISHIPLSSGTDRLVHELIEEFSPMGGIRISNQSRTELIMNRLRSPTEEILHAKLPKPLLPMEDAETLFLSHVHAKPVLPVFTVRPYQFKTYPDMAVSALLLYDAATPGLVSQEQITDYLSLQDFVFGKFDDFLRGTGRDTHFLSQYLQMTLQDVLYHRFMREHADDPVYKRQQRQHLTHSELMERAKQGDNPIFLDSLFELGEQYSAALEWFKNSRALDAETIVDLDSGKESNCFAGYYPSIIMRGDFGQVQAGHGAALSLARSCLTDSHEYALPYVFFDNTLDELAEQYGSDYGVSSGLTMDDFAALRQQRIAAGFIFATREASGLMELGDLSAAKNQLMRAHTLFLSGFVNF